MYPRHWDGVRISNLDKPDDMLALAREVAAFAGGQGCWMVASKDAWSPAKTALLGEILGDTDYVAETRETRGTIGLKVMAKTK